MTEDFSEQDLSLLSHLTGLASSFGLVGAEVVLGF
jgi:hypothetical protein